jgi:hypothetical protein
MQRLCILSTMQYMAASSLFQRFHQLFWMCWEATKAATQVCVWRYHRRTSSFVFGARRRLHGVSQHTRSSHHWLHSTTTEPAHVSLLIIIVLTYTLLSWLSWHEIHFPLVFCSRAVKFFITLDAELARDAENGMECSFQLHTSVLHHKFWDT